MFVFMRHRTLPCNGLWIPRTLLINASFILSGEQTGSVVSFLVLPIPELMESHHSRIPLAMPSWPSLCIISLVSVLFEQPFSFSRYSFQLCIFLRRWLRACSLFPELVPQSQCMSYDVGYASCCHRHCFPFFPLLGTTFF